jgi:pimeloyl-ACP methyl ester carboxylesterase
VESVSEKPVDGAVTPESPPEKLRSTWAAIAIAVVVVGTVLLALLAAPSQTLDVAAAPAAAADTNITKSPDIPTFYDVFDTPTQPPGTMVKSEVILGSPEGTKAYRFIYHSRDLNGANTVVSGVFITPTTPAPEGGFPLVTYAHGTTGSNRHCGISLTPFEPNTPGFQGMNQMLPLVQEGYAVVGTDYQGMGAPGDPSYLVGQIEGQNTLDAVRAVHNWQQNVNKDETIIWGHSQGGHSAAFAAQIAPDYAPELAIQGAAVLSPGLLPSLPLAVQGLLAGTEPSGQTGFVMLIAASWAATYPDQLNPEDILTPAGVAKLPIVNRLCGSQQSDAFMDAPMSTYVKDPVPAVFYDLATQNTPGAEKTKMPIVMVQGMKDTTIIPQLTLAFNKQMCQIGNTVDFHVYPDDVHSSVVTNSRSLIQQWMQDRIDDQPAPNGCTNQ